jgi:S1-C subfamily serine protease
MKALLGMALALALGCSAFADGIANVEINGNQYSNITKVFIGTGGRVIIYFPSGGTSASADKVPADFLASWNINKESQDAAKAAEAQKTAGDLERAIQLGSFREIDGVVYDTRKSQSGWVFFPKAKVIQVLDDGAILDITPDADSFFAAHVKNLGSAIGDTDTISFKARLTGNYSYINKNSDDRTIREYDAGRPCSRDEIPDSVLSGKKAFDFLTSDGAPSKNLIASLPESDDLKSSGSGFFITDDGYLVSNNHVVKGATKVRLITSGGTLDATVVQVDVANDLALLKVSGKFLPWPIAESRTVHLGVTVATVGFPEIVSQGFAPKLAKGEIASLSGIQDDPGYFQISVPVQHGNSGGALVDEHGNVVGVVSAKLGMAIGRAQSSDELPENVNYAVKSSLLLNFLESVPGISAKLKQPTTADRKFEDVVKSAQDAAVLILVY